MRSANTFQARGWGVKHDSFTALHVIETFYRSTPRSFNPAVAPRPCVFVPRHRPRRRGARPSIFSEINLEMSANHVPVSEGGFFFSPVSTSRSSVFGELGRPRWRPRGACSAALSGVRETSREKRRDSKRRVAGGHNAPAWASEQFFLLGEGEYTQRDDVGRRGRQRHGRGLPALLQPVRRDGQTFSSVQMRVPDLRLVLAPA